MVLCCIARVVGIKRSVRGRDFVTKWANTDHIEPEHAIYEIFLNTTGVTYNYIQIYGRLG